MTGHLVVLLRGREVAWHGPRALVFKVEGAEGHWEVTHVPPVLPPRVAHNPEFPLHWVCPPAHHRNDVISVETVLLDNARLVIEKGVGVNAAADGSPLVDLLHHRLSAGNGSEVRDGGVRKAGEARARASLVIKAATSACNVDGLARPIGRLAEALGGFRRARHVRLGSFIADASASLGDPLEPLVGPINAPTVATADISTIQHVLHGEVDVGALGPTCDLDAITKGRDCTMRPAGSAVLGNVLIAAHGTVIHAVLVAPREVVGVLFSAQKLVMRV
mmetsp:Transcript_166528/g.404666  ORF Transcript_166528/g.404666 Transcript_166528/m.404666 type:complete len:276 (-) Transcript_166528:351-1178(-)